MAGNVKKVNPVMVMLIAIFVVSVVALVVSLFAKQTIVMADGSTGTISRMGKKSSALGTGDPTETNLETVAEEATK